VVGQHTLDEALSETDVINANIQKILDVATLEWGVEVHLVELKDIQLPDSMKRAMARQAEAEREKRAKIIAAEGESMAAAALGEASDTMMAHPLACNCGICRRWPSSEWRRTPRWCFPAPMMSRDRRNQQLPHPGNRRRARDHTPAAPAKHWFGDRGGTTASPRSLARRRFPGEEAADFADRAHHRRREHHRGVLLHSELGQRLQIPQLQGERVRHHRVRRFP